MPAFSHNLHASHMQPIQSSPSKKLRYAKPIECGLGGSALMPLQKVISIMHVLSGYAEMGLDVQM